MYIYICQKYLWSLLPQTTAPLSYSLWIRNVTCCINKEGRPSSHQPVKPPDPAS